MFVHHISNQGFLCETWASRQLNLPVMQETACNAGDVGLIPRPERSPEKEEATCSNILAWEMPWTEEPGSYSPWGARVRYDLVD